MAAILVLHGPNLNLLGEREPAHYGRTSLAAIDADLRTEAAAAGHALSSFQSNAEHALIERVHAAAGEGVAAILLNPAGYTHTSVALRDAVLSCGVPVVEVHLTNPQAREEFRRVSLLADVCAGSVAGFGWQSYVLALLWFHRCRRG